MIFAYFADNPILIIPWIIALLVAVIFHEVAHGYVAYRLGDYTAAYAGRLTLNPLAHLDWLGTLMLLLIGLGWAKPVPINVNNLSKGNFGKFLVSIAGIATNFLIAIISLLALKLVLSFGFSDSNLAVKFLGFIAFINVALGIFNLLPIAPLDGYRALETFLPRNVFLKIAPFMEVYGIFILIFLVFLTNIPSYIIFGSAQFLFHLFSVPLSIVF